MRFHQLPVGARFTFEGQSYTKTSSLLASSDGSGAGRMIPRSAAVSPLDPSSAGAGGETDASVPLSEAAGVLEGLRDEALACMDEVAQGQPRESARAGVEEAYRRALARLRRVTRD